MSGPEAHRDEAAACRSPPRHVDPGERYTPPLPRDARAALSDSGGAAVSHVSRHEPLRARALLDGLDLESVRPTQTSVLAERSRARQDLTPPGDRPEAAATVDPRNVRRVVRTSRHHSHRGVSAAGAARPVPALKIGLGRAQLLIERIEPAWLRCSSGRARVGAYVDDRGMLRDAEHIAHDTSIDSCCAAIAGQRRRSDVPTEAYSRRHITWFRPTQWLVRPVTVILSHSLPRRLPNRIVRVMIHAPRARLPRRSTTAPRFDGGSLRSSRSGRGMRCRRPGAAIHSAAPLSHTWVGRQGGTRDRCRRVAADIIVTTTAHTDPATWTRRVTNRRVWIAPR